MKKAINTRITKKEALLNGIKQQTKERQKLTIKFNNIVLEKLTLPELKQILEINVKCNEKLKKAVANPNDSVYAIKTRLKNIKNNVLKNKHK